MDFGHSCTDLFHSKPLLTKKEVYLVIWDRMILGVQLCERVHHSNFACKDPLNMNKQIIQEGKL